MTNNLKAERTLTAEDRVSEKRLAQMIEDANLQYLAAGFPDLCALWQDRIDAFTELQSLRSRSQSLSTQQPMGEPVLWRMKDCADGWIFVRTREAAEAAAANGNLIQPLYALHPNQESGE